MLQRLILQKRRFVFCFVLVFLGILIYGLGAQSSVQLLLLRALFVATYALTFCIIGIIFTPKCRPMGDLTVIIVFVSSLIYQFLRTWELEPATEGHFLIFGAAVGAAVGFLLFGSMARRLGWSFTSTANSSFSTSSSKEEVWRALCPVAGEEAYEWSGTLISIAENGPHQHTSISAIGWGQFFSTETIIENLDAPTAYEAKSKVSIGKFKNDKFSVKTPNLMKFRHKLLIEEQSDGRNHVSSEVTYFDLSPILALNFFLEEFGADIGQSMMAHFEGSKDWSITGAISARGRRVATKLRAV